MDIHRVYGLLNRRFRERRMAAFAARFGPTRETTILDVGGTDSIWSQAPVLPRVTLVNLQPPARELPEFTYVTTDATRLPFGDRSFDICFSNSVIEHLGTRERQRALADEIQRVGRALWVQTPARAFPLEPHLITPFIHWLPKRLRRRLVRRGTVWGLVTKPTQAQAESLVDEIVLLSRRDMAELFPTCEIVVERFLGLPKAYVAVRRTA
jgi:Methyltransferase domain